MSTLHVVLLVTALLAAASVATVVGWLGYSLYLSAIERRLAARKGLYREMVAGLAWRDQESLGPAIHQLSTLRDIEALEAVLEEQARGLTDRPAWLLDAYDRLGLVDKYIDRLAHGRRWRDRAFAAELLGRVGNGRAVPALLATIQATADEDGDVREIALRALARIGDPSAVGPLIEALQRSEVWLAPRVADILARHGPIVADPLLAFLNAGGPHPGRAWAAAVLGEVRATHAFPSLVQALNDLDDEVRAKTATALGRLGDRRAIPFLLDRLLTDPIPFVRARIAGALGRFPDEDVSERLVRALGDPAWWVRMRSVEALEQIGVGAEGSLVMALDDADPEIRGRAAISLERLGLPARLVAGIAAGTAPGDATETLVKFAAAGARELLAEHLTHPSPAVRTAVLEAIRRAGRRELDTEIATVARSDHEASLRTAAFETLRALNLASAVPVALEALADPAEEVRAAALLLIGDLGDAGLTDALRPRATDPTPRVRAAVARALGLIRSTTAQGEVRRLLGDPSPEVRAAAARAAGDAGWQETIPTLIELLGDGDGNVRIAAVNALRILDAREAVPALLRRTAGAELSLREAVAEAVARLEMDSIPALLDQVMGEPDSKAKLTVVRALLHSRSKDAVQFLAVLWRDPDATVRAAVAEALGWLGGPDAAKLLESGLDDPDPIARAQSIDGLVRTDHTPSAARVVALLEHDPSSEVRERAALATGLLQAPGGAAALTAACAMAEPVEVRAAAAVALGLFEGESVVARVVAMSDDEDVRLYLRAQLRIDSQYRLVAVKLRDSRHAEFQALGADSLTEMESALAEGVRSELDPDARQRLVQGLRAFRGARSRGTLVRTVRSDPSPEVRAAALAAASDLLDRDELLTIARQTLGDPHPVVRRTAVGLFARIPPQDALPSLVRLLRTDDDETVLQAVATQAEEAFDVFVDLTLGSALDGHEALMVARVARHIHHAGLERLLPPIAQSRNPDVRTAVAELWAARPDLVDAAALHRLSMDPEVPVRRAAAAALSALHRRADLEAMIGDPDAGIRALIARALGGFEGKIPALKGLGEDPDEGVRAAAAISRIIHGEIDRLPPSVSHRAATAAARAAADPESLRLAVRTEPSVERRRGVALLLALVDPEFARTIADKDPAPRVRESVALMLRGGLE